MVIFCCGFKNRFFVVTLFLNLLSIKKQCLLGHIAKVNCLKRCILDHIVKIACITQCICDIANTYCISVLLCATTSASGLLSLNRHLGGQNIISLSHFYFNKAIKLIQLISIKICDKKLASFSTFSISFSKIVYLF